MNLNADYNGEWPRSEDIGGGSVAVVEAEPELGQEGLESGNGAGEQLWKESHL